MWQIIVDYLIGSGFDSGVELAVLMIVSDRANYH